MTPTVSIDTTEFQAATRELLKWTSRSLPEFLNSRNFYLMLRCYILTKPHSPQSERNRIKAYMTEQIGDRRMDRSTGKRVGKGRTLQRRHLIAQAKNTKAGNKGLYGDSMKKAAASLLRRAIGSVGYLKSGWAKAIKKQSGHFSQFGYSTKKSGGVQVPGNAALIALANQYGLPQENVAMHKGTHAHITRARDGFNPVAISDIAWEIANGQDGRVAAVLNPAAEKAFADETKEMQAHLARYMQDGCNQFMEKPL